MATRVIRPAKISTETRPVHLPQLQIAPQDDSRLPGETQQQPATPAQDDTRSAGAAAGDTAATAAPPSELEQLRAENEQLKQRLREHDEQHIQELQATHTRVIEGLRRVEESVASLTSVVDTFEEQREAAQQESETVVQALALAIARRIVGDSVALREDIVLHTVRRALQLARERERVVIRVNPADLKLVQQHAEEWLQLVERSRSLDIEEDARVGRGGCLIETERGNIEAQVEKQLAALEEVLVEASQ